MEALVSAVEGLRDAVEGARLPLDVTTRAPAEAARKQLLQQLDDGAGVVAVAVHADAQRPEAPQDQEAVEGRRHRAGGGTGAA